MRRTLRLCTLGLLWITAALLTALESLLVWGWPSGTLYVMKSGAAENPYAAEDAEIAGFCALALLPLTLAALAEAMGWTVLRCKKRAEARARDRGERYADDLL